MASVTAKTTYDVSMLLSIDELRELHRLMHWVKNCIADINNLQLSVGRDTDANEVEMLQHLQELAIMINPELIELASQVDCHISGYFY